MEEIIRLGREVAISSWVGSPYKVRNSGIPTCAMGCYKIPLNLCHEIEVLIKKFCWEEQGGQRKIHWLRWDEMTKSQWFVVRVSKI